MPPKLALCEFLLFFNYIFIYIHLADLFTIAPSCDMRRLNPPYIPHVLHLPPVHPLRPKTNNHHDHQPGLSQDT